MLTVHPDALALKLGWRIIRWRGAEGLGAQAVATLRSGLGKQLRHLACPEHLWQQPCRGCAREADCVWPKQCPGSAYAGDGPLAPWALRGGAGALISVHAGLDTRTLAAFWLALEASLGTRLNRDHGSWTQGPRWLGAELADAEGSPLSELRFLDPDLPSSPPPRTLRQGDRLRLAMPMSLKGATPSGPPPMSLWLRLGRNRISRFAAQRGQPIWPGDDPRWKELSELAEAARWTWLNPHWETAAGVVPKHRFPLQGWTGTVHIDQLPEDLAAWASLLPHLGCGSHVQYGCGFMTLLPRERTAMVPPGVTTPMLQAVPDPTGNAPGPLRWKPFIAS